MTITHGPRHDPAPFDPTHRDNKRHLSPGQLAFIAGLVCGVVAAAMVGVWL